MATIILLKNNDMVKSTIISGNIDTDKLIPALKAYQETYLRQILGKPLYIKMCEDFKNSALTGPYLELYEDYVQPMVIYGSTALYLESGAYMVANSGITKLNTETSQSVTKDEVDYLVHSAQKLHNVYEREFLKWIPGKDIPEYPGQASCGGSGNRIIVGGWSLKKRGGC